VNNYIYPLVHELLQLCEGVTIKTSEHSELNIKAALCCVTSDLPATKKLCGFASHAAMFECSKCLKRFSNRGDKSGFEQSEWIRRDHRSTSNAYKQSKTNTQQDLIPWS
jgi:hypothetical protein